MKSRTLVIIVVVQGILMLTFLVYALVQRTQAEAARVRAQQNEEMAMIQASLAQEQQKLCEERLRALENK